MSNKRRKATARATAKAGQAGQAGQEKKLFPNLSKPKIRKKGAGEKP